MTMVRRRATAEVERKLASARAVIVNGPRQSGKTELLRLVHAHHDGVYTTLDDTASLGAARRDPRTFIERDARPIIIDEFQRAGDPLLLALKTALDLSIVKGQFLLAGSTRFLTEPRLSESLAGRVRFVDLWPFSQGEIDDRPDGFIDALAADAETFTRGTKASNGRLSRGQAALRIARGGFPEAVQASNERDRLEFFDDYLRTVLQRDIRELSRLQMVDDLPRLVSLLAARTATELNFADLANDAGLGQDTARRYVALLETLYLFYRLPAFAATTTGREKRRPKLHVVDSGLSAYIQRETVGSLTDPVNSTFGPLFESFIVGELARQTTWSRERVSLSHWHDSRGREVDVIAELGNGTIVPIEIKATKTPDNDDIKHLRHLRAKEAGRFKFGLVICLVDEVQPLDDRILAVPAGAVWGTSP